MNTRTPLTPGVYLTVICLAVFFSFCACTNDVDIKTFEKLLNTQKASDNQRSAKHFFVLFKDREWDHQPAWEEAVAAHEVADEASVIPLSIHLKSSNYDPVQEDMFLDDDFEDEFDMDDEFADEEELERKYREHQELKEAKEKHRAEQRVQQLADKEVTLKFMQQHNVAEFGPGEHPGLYHFVEGNPRGEKFNGDLDKDQMIDFIISKLSPELQALSELAAGFTAIGEEEQQQTLKKATETVEQLKKSTSSARLLNKGEFYVTVMKRLIKEKAGAKAFVDKEVQRMSKIVKEGTVASKKREDLMQRAAVLRAFSKMATDIPL